MKVVSSRCFGLVHRAAWVFAAGISLVSAGYAAVRLPQVFSEGMVLQREKPVLIWGWADPGEPVTVEIAGQQQRTTANLHGRWQVTLEPVRASSAVYLVVRGAANALAIEEVLVGEVFLCSGQSNMAMSMAAATRLPGVADDLAAANFPEIRFFKTPDLMSKMPEQDIAAKWEPITPENLPKHSAVAFYFSRALHAHLGVPIGIIRASHAGGPAEAKMPLPALLQLDIGRAYYESARKREQSWTPERMASFNLDMLSKWEAAVKESEARGAKPPSKPTPRRSAIDFSFPASDYNAQIAPVIAYGKRAVLWYQGEHNASRTRAFEYRRLFPALIHSWRDEMGDPGMPFIFVQLPAFGASPGDDWPALRESQLLTLRAVPRTGLVTTIDTGERDNIHPADKFPVGERLSREVRRLAFGENVSGCGPLAASHSVTGDRVVVRFDFIGGGLVGRDGATLGGFTIAAADRKFVPANAAIVGDTVVVSSPAAPQPVAVRYAWEAWPTVSLFNREGLPASPFRTDDWDLTPLAP